jgi:hypothetical protein
MSWNLVFVFVTAASIAGSLQLNNRVRVDHVDRLTASKRTLPGVGSQRKSE